MLDPAIADGGGDGARIRARLRGQVIAGPDLLRLEVVSVLRRQLVAGLLTREQAASAVADLLDLPVWVVPTAPLLARAWELRDNLTAYDAAYVALAEALDAPLLTVDVRLARVPGLRCQVELV